MENRLLQHDLLFIDTNKKPYMFATPLTRPKDFTSLPYLLLHVNNSFCRILSDTVAHRQLHQEKYLSSSTPHDAEVSLKYF